MMLESREPKNSVRGVLPQILGLAHYALSEFDLEALVKLLTMITPF